MRNPVLLGAAAAASAALLLAGGGIAFAQEAPVLQVDASAACGRVTLDAQVNQTFGENDTYEIAVFSGPNAGTAASTPEGQFFVSADDPARQTFTLAEDAYEGDGFLSWTTVSGPNPEFYVRGTIAVDTDCAPPVTTPTATPAPTATPTVAPPVPTVTPAPTTTPAVDDDAGPLYATCAEASAAGAAPINVGEPGYLASLDSDDDGVACEVYDSSALPVGGAATGG